MRPKMTILIPAMLDETFELMKPAFASKNVKVVLLKNRADLINTGLGYVHNDLCYPSVLLVGQLVNALRSGRYDEHNCAFLCAQAGDACRGSNYIPLLRKAVKKAGYDIPVLSFNFMGMEEGARFDITPMFLLKALSGLMYSDMLMILKNQVRPYEVNRGETDRLYEKWRKKLAEDIFRGRHLLSLSKTFDRIAEDFAKIPRTGEEKPKIGMVGELYMKYCAIGNRDLQRFYEDKGAEVRINGFSWYVLYYIDTHLTQLSPLLSLGYRTAGAFIEHIQKKMIRSVRSHGFECLDSFTPFKARAESRIPCTCNVGDGWLIGAEIVNHAFGGTLRTACVQPFGCMPSHVCGRGLYSSIQRRLSDLGVRLVSIDFDSSGTDVNIYNRAEILLMPDMNDIGITSP